MSERAGCFKIGCFGCLALVGLSVVVLFVMTAVQFRYDRSDREIRSAQIAHQLPAAPPPPARVLEALPEDAQSSRPLPLSELADADRELKIGLVEIDLSIGEFEIEAGKPGEPIRIEGEYEAGGFELEEELSELDDGSWRYRVRFGPRSGMLGLALSGAGNNPDNRLKLILPPGQPMDLVGSIGIGETAVDLGGLWLRDVDLDLGVGQHTIEFSQPMLVAIERLSLRKGVGELEVGRVGNASPRSIDIRQSVGSLRLDLRGAWSQDAKIDLRLGIGEQSISLPRNARVELDDVAMSLVGKSVDLPDDSDLAPDAPTLRLRVRGRLGELDIH